MYKFVTGMQLCFGQPVDIEILTLLRSKIDEVSEAVQTWMLKKNEVFKLFCVVRYTMWLQCGLMWFAIAFCL